MSNFWAKFKEINGNIYRYDTRVYINSINSIEIDDICIGAIVGKNPGSAKGEVSQDLKAINLDGDKLLPTVRNILQKSYDLTKVSIPTKGYIQVLNLFYLCEPNLNLAIDEAKEKTIKGICETENKDFPFVWFAWGGNDIFLNNYKERFSSIKTNKPFYYDYGDQEISKEIPKNKSSAKHTQGLKHNLVVPYLATLLND